MNIESISIILQHLQLASFLNNKSVKCLSEASTTCHKLLQAHISNNATFYIYFGATKNLFSSLPSIAKKRVVITKFMNNSEEEEEKICNSALNLPATLTHLQIVIFFKLNCTIDFPSTLQYLSAHVTFQSIDKLPTTLKALTLPHLHNSQNIDNLPSKLKLLSLMHYGPRTTL